MKWQLFISRFLNRRKNITTVKFFKYSVSSTNVFSVNDCTAVVYFDCRHRRVYWDYKACNTRTTGKKDLFKLFKLDSKLNARSTRVQVMTALAYKW